MLYLPERAATLAAIRQEAGDRYAAWLVDYISLNGWGPDYMLQRTVTDGREISVIFDASNFVRMGISLPAPFQEIGKRADLWIYYKPLTALIEALRWDGLGEPFGWNRHPATARRRPDGDAAREYIWE